MLSEKVVDELFESAKPYFRVRRLLLCLIFLLLCSNDGFSFLLSGFFEVSFKDAVSHISKAIYAAPMFLTLFSVSVCFYFGPKANHWVAMKCLAINSKLNFIKDIYKRAEEENELSEEELASRNKRFVLRAKRVKVLLEVWMTCVLLYQAVLFGMEWRLWVSLSVFFLIVAFCFLFYIEVTSALIREYARSGYLLRVLYDG